MKVATKITKKKVSVSTAKSRTIPNKFWLEFHTEWSKWGKGGSKDHEVLGPFKSKRAAVKAAEQQIEDAMGGCTFDCEITDDIIETDNRKTPPDCGELLVVRDDGDYQTHFVEISKGSEKPRLECRDSDSDEDDENEDSDVDEDDIYKRYL